MTDSNGIRISRVDNKREYKEQKLYTHVLCC